MKTASMPRSAKLLPVCVRGAPRLTRSRSLNRSATPFRMPPSPNACSRRYRKSSALPLADELTHHGDLVEQGRLLNRRFDLDSDRFGGAVIEHPTEQFQILRKQRLVQIDPLIAFPTGACNVNFTHFVQRQSLQISFCVR